MLELQGFEQYLIKEERSRNTIECYLRDCRTFIGWYGGRLDDLSELDVIRYKKHLISTSKTVITANRKLASVNAFCRYLYENRTLQDIVGARLVKNRDKREYKGMEEQELRQLRQQIHTGNNPMHICIIEVLLGTGMRVSELCNLTVKDILLTDSKSQIRVLGKGMVNRTLPLNEDARKAVENYLGVRPDSKEENLLIGQRGAIGRNAVNLILEKYGKQIGVEVTPHKLRHSLAYKLVKAGTPMTTIQQILGHESILTTNLYTQTAEKDKIEALAGLNW